MALTAEEKFEFWLEKAQYDLDTADAMFRTGRWFYVIFACQQIGYERPIRQSGIRADIKADKRGVPMVADLETVMPVVQDYIAKVKQEIPIDKIVLFGSYAKGTQSEWSDVDLCFFSNIFTAENCQDIGSHLFGMAGDYNRDYNRDVIIEPHIMPTSELDNDNPFVKEILRTGREL